MNDEATSDEGWDAHQPLGEAVMVTELPDAPARPEEGHKGTFGTVIVVGGSETMLGAPALCATAAFRCGTGLVKIAAAADVLRAVILIEPSATGLVLPEDFVSAASVLDAADPKQEAVLAVGPGMGRSVTAGLLVHALVRGPRRLVLDADGLNLLAQSPGGRAEGSPPLVMTPHPGEFRRLAAAVGIAEDPTDHAARPAAARKLARAYKAVVLLKGRQTVVSDGTRVYINQSGSAALATAGSGDVLTGVIASLMGQGMEPFEAAVLGAHLHGVAAELWTWRSGPSGMLARDLAGLLPRAMMVHRGGSWGDWDNRGDRQGG